VEALYARPAGLTVARNARQDEAGAQPAKQLRSSRAPDNGRLTMTIECDRPVDDGPAITPGRHADLVAGIGSVDRLLDRRVLPRDTPDRAGASGAIQDRARQDHRQCTHHHASAELPSAEHHTPPPKILVSRVRDSLRLRQTPTYSGKLLGSSKVIRMGPRTHLILGIAVVLILPALSWWRGTGAFAFTMFSGSGSYRLRIVAIDHAGNAHRVPPTAVAARAEGTVGNLLAGSEEWRFAPFGPLLRQRINQIATLSCGARAGSHRILVTLEERRTLDAPVRISDETVVCP
jgi:hypothetical protein